MIREAVVITKKEYEGLYGLCAIIREELNEFRQYKKIDRRGGPTEWETRLMNILKQVDETVTNVIA